MEEQSRVSELLTRLHAGDGAASEELIPLVYAELHEIAERLMRGEQVGHTLQATALVNEVWVKLAGANAGPLEGRSHFLRVAARAMRHVLVDHARAKRAAKRGQRADAGSVFFEQWFELAEVRSLDLLSLNEALERLGGIDETAKEVVELRFFAGLTIGEVSSVLEISTATVERKWRTARAWLRAEVVEPGGN